ncbi:MAG TPA: hypothetical protein VKG45_09485 [Actinomycetes bacterium]|nr:hypothetical protein [Actinomycetes bacterium]
MQDPQRLRFVASRFNHLQGLVAVPPGAALAINALLAIRSPGHSVLSTPLQALVLAVGLLAGLAFIPYYRRTFGQVHPAPWTRTRDARAAGIFIAIGLVWFGVVIGFQLPESLGLVGLGAAFGGIVLANAKRYGGLQLLWATWAAAITGIGLLSLLGLLPDTPTGKLSSQSGLNWSQLAWGLAWVVGGILDHLVLVRTMRSAQVADGSAV